MSFVCRARFFVLMVLASLAFAPLPAFAQGPPDPPSGATPDEAKVPIGHEFDPNATNLNLPKPDPRFTNNAAMNNLVAPVENLAPSLEKQDEEKMDTDFQDSATLTKDEKTDQLKEEASTKKREIMHMLNGKKRKTSLDTQDDADTATGEDGLVLPSVDAAEEDMNGEPPSLPGAEAEPEASPKAAIARSGKEQDPSENGGFKLAPPLPDPDKSNVKERASDATFGVENTDKGARYKRPGATTSTSKGGAVPPAAAAAKVAASAPDAVAPDATTPEAIDDGADEGDAVAPISTEKGGPAGPPKTDKGKKKKGAAKSKKNGKGSTSSSKKGKANEEPEEPKMVKEKSSQHVVDDLFNQLNQ